MRLAQTLHLAVSQIPASHTAGWLRWYILGTIVLIGVLAWLCLRGYSKGNGDQ
jgi:hypothetical protein